MDQTFDEVVLGTVLLFLSPCSEENKGTETKGPSPNKQARKRRVSCFRACSGKVLWIEQRARMGSEKKQPLPSVFPFYKFEWAFRKSRGVSPTRDRKVRLKAILSLLSMRRTCALPMRR